MASAPAGAVGLGGEGLRPAVRPAVAGRGIGKFDGGRRASNSEVVPRFPLFDPVSKFGIRYLPVSLAIGWFVRGYLDANGQVGTINAVGCQLPQNRSFLTQTVLGRLIAS